MNTVILITDNEDIKNKICGSLVLLRKSDVILQTSYGDAPDIVYDRRPDIVIIHENDDREKTLNIVRYLKEKRIFDNTNIILLVNKYDRDFILNSYDEGIDDYFSIESDSSEMLIRTINCIKKSEKNKEIKNLKYYLSCYGITSEGSGFYSPKFAKEIFELELIHNDFLSGSFMVIAPDEEGKKEFSDSKISFAIKKSIRSGDVVAESLGSKYYLLLNTDVSGALLVLDKIKTFLPEGLSVKAGIAKVNTRKFSDIEKRAVCALNNAMLNDRDYVIHSLPHSADDNWLAESEDEGKSYKFFKNVFNKKLEKVIAPVFYRLQKTYEDKFVNTKIEQYTSDTESVFRLANARNEGRLKIVYPGFSKIIVYIVYSGLDSPENREITLPINLINQKEIVKIVEDFINEFVGYINKERT